MFKEIQGISEDSPKPGRNYNLYILEQRAKLDKTRQLHHQERICSRLRKDNYGSKWICADICVSKRQIALGNEKVIVLSLTCSLKLLAKQQKVFELRSESGDGISGIPAQSPEKVEEEGGPGCSGNGCDREKWVLDNCSSVSISHHRHPRGQRLPSSQIFEYVHWLHRTHIEHQI